MSRKIAFEAFVARNPAASWAEKYCPSLVRLIAGTAEASNARATDEVAIRAAKPRIQRVRNFMLLSPECVTITALHQRKVMRASSGGMPAVLSGRWCFQATRFLASYQA